MDPSPSLSSSSPPPTDPLAEWWAGWRDRLPLLRRPATVVAALVAVAVVGLLAVLLARPAQGPPPRLTLPVAAADAAPPGAGPSGPSTTASGATATVHAAGAVVSPGVYALPAGARVADVVAAAGGPLPEADLDRVNLATLVTDGERVHLPRKGEAAPAGTDAASAPTSTAPAAPVDLNAATLDQLDGLPGIGPATAQAILTYRTRHGRFRSVNELVEVPGIGPSKLEAVRPLVKV